MIENSHDFLLEWAMLSEEPPFRDNLNFKKVEGRAYNTGVFEGPDSGIPTRKPEWISENDFRRRVGDNNEDQYPYIDPHDPRQVEERGLPYIPGHLPDANGAPNRLADKSAPNNTDLNPAPAPDAARAPVIVNAAPAPALPSPLDDEDNLRDKRNKADEKIPEQLEQSTKKDEAIPLGDSAKEAQQKEAEAKQREAEAKQREAEAKAKQGRIDLFSNSFYSM